MASSFPGAIDSFADPLSTSPLNSPSHAGQHQDINDAVEKLETKLGVGASPASSAANGMSLVANGSGSTTWAYSGGLVYVGGGNISGTATSFDNVFTSTYRNYKIFVTFDGGSDIATTLKLRAASGDQTNNYYVGSLLVDSSSISNQSQNNTADYRFGYHYTNSGTSTSEITISNPQISTVNTGISGFGGHYYPAAPNARTVTFGGVHSLVQANHGFTIFASGTTTGKVRIFGIREP